MEGNENTAVLDIWDKAFPDAEPLAWILREKKQKNWFRLYSLPNGKRYATNSKERAEVLRRSNFVFDTLFRDNKNEILTLIPVEKLSVEYEKFNRYNSKSLIELGYKKFFKYINNERGEIYLIYYEINLNNNEKFEGLINLISKDIVMQPIFWNLKGTIFSPYDGGIDVFAFDEEQLNSFKKKLGEWLSDMPSGL